MYVRIFTRGVVGRGDLLVILCSRRVGFVTPVNSSICHLGACHACSQFIGHFNGVDNILESAFLFNVFKFKTIIGGGTEKLMQL